MNLRPRSPETNDHQPRCWHQAVFEHVGGLGFLFGSAQVEGVVEIDGVNRLALQAESQIRNEVDRMVVRGALDDLAKAAQPHLPLDDVLAEQAHGRQAQACVGVTARRLGLKAFGFLTGRVRMPLRTDCVIILHLSQRNWHSAGWVGALYVPGWGIPDRISVDPNPRPQALGGSLDCAATFDDLQRCPLDPQMLGRL